MSRARGQKPEDGFPEPGDDKSAIKRARYIMIGGFLGAGKTTAVARLAQRLTEQGLRVGLITNDQGSELVDTAMLRSRGFATEEIPGGCFCYVRRTVMSLVFVVVLRIVSKMKPPVRAPLTRRAQ